MKQVTTVAFRFSAMDISPRLSPEKSRQLRKLQRFIDVNNRRR
jgi:hypothetical protein